MRRKVYICAWLEPDEKKQVTDLAKQAHLTVSDLIRNLVLGRRLPTTEKHEDVLALAKINADLARLGNLLRMAIDDEDVLTTEGMDLDGLIANIKETQTTLKTKIREI